MPMKPKVPKGPGSMTVFRRSSAVNQQQAQATRPQLPRDHSQGGRPIYASGEMPKGGYQSMWTFNGSVDTKDSRTAPKAPGRKVY